MRIKLDPGAYMPLRGYAKDAGLDLRTPEDIVIPKGKSVLVDTGVHVEIQPGTAGLLVSKSGLNTNHGITSTGLIDAGYTGSIAVKLYNHGEDDISFAKGDKITQLVILPVYIPEHIDIVESVDDLYDGSTERGANGFGSTGR